MLQENQQIPQKVHRDAADAGYGTADTGDEDAAVSEDEDAADSYRKIHI